MMASDFQVFYIVWQSSIMTRQNLKSCMKIHPHSCYSVDNFYM
jgi:hypothetical protein